MQKTGSITKPQFEKRSLTSLLVFISFIWLIPTGIGMHFSDQPSTEITRHLFMTMHNTAAFIFSISVIVHLTINWKSIKRYILSKPNVFPPIRMEMLLAVIAVSGLIMLVGSHALH